MQATKSKARKLTIHLIKPELTELNLIIAPDQPMTEFPLGKDGDLGTLFVRPVKPKDATWTEFFKGHVPINAFNQVSSAGGLLLVRHIQRIFAITFGTGHHLLTDDCCEERFGLRIALNCIHEDGVKCIDKNRLDNIARQSREQSSKQTEFRDFGMDTERDLLSAVTGEPIDKSQFGNWITGKDSVTVSISVSLETLPALLERLYEKSNDEFYKTRFDWIEHLAAVKDKGRIDELNNLLIAAMQQPSRSNIWMAVPEVMNWNNLSGFCFPGRRNEMPPDIHLDTFLQSLDENEAISIDLLKTRRIDWEDGDGARHKGWSAYECLYGEIEDDDGNTFLLNGKKWYRAETDFVKQVNKTFKAIPDYSPELPVYDSDSEAAYLLETGRSFPTRYTVLDQQTIMHGGGRSKIEFCDLLSSTKDLIHVKHYSQSAPLSHLFAQGLVSGESFQADSQFRKKLNQKLPEPRKLTDPSVRPKDKEYGVVFAIISDREGPLKIPFFARLTLRHVAKRLEFYGFRVAKAKISVAETRALTKRVRSKAKGA